MIASATYEDWCALTEGTRDWDAEAEAHSDEAFLQSLFATAPTGGEMEAIEIGLGDHDGDENARIDPGEMEALEDRLTLLDETSRAIVAGNALASCSDDHGTIVVLQWLCKVGPDARAVVAREAAALVANQHASERARALVGVV